MPCPVKEIVLHSPKSTQKLKGGILERERTALVTGCSSGIGRATAVALQMKGWNVAATMRRPEEERELGSLPNVKLYRLDVCDKESIAKAFAEAKRDFGSITTVVNNAGYGLIGAFEEIDEEQIRQQFDTNVFGLMAVTREAIGYLKPQGGGSIIQVASVGGRLTFPLYSLYHATKWAVEGFSESLQYELRPFNIKVKIIEPGPIKTNFYSTSNEYEQEEHRSDYSDFIRRAMKNMKQSVKFGSPPEVTADIIVKAAEDTSWRLRYAAGGNAAPLLLLRKLLPDALFNGMVRGVVLRSS